MSKKTSMTMIAGLDIGNGYVKGLTQIGKGESEGIDFPSCIVRQYAEATEKSVGPGVGATIENIFDELECTIDSPVVHSVPSIQFGRRALKTGYTAVQFDVAATEGKATDELSPTLVLGCIAGRALQHYWREHGELPADIVDVHVDAALALPISEYKRQRDPYSMKYTGSSHMVSIRNFENPVRIRVFFDSVTVLAEGASAQYAIMAKGEPLMQAMLEDCRSMGAKLEDITAQDVLESKNTIGIDIGEGTVNFPVYFNGQFEPDSSMTLNRGFGHVMERALEKLRERNYQFKDRKELAEFLHTEPSGVAKRRWSRVAEVVTTESIAFSDEIVSMFRQLMARVGGSIDVIYVYGGGATEMRDTLYPALVKASMGMGSGDDGYPVLYLDSRYSRKLNREGLFLVAKQLSDAAKDAEPEASEG